jgi:DNA-directed RNA polymerase III subunit RPC11
VEVPTVKKEVDDVLGGEEAWADKEKTEHVCPNPECRHNEAYFMMIQVGDSGDSLFSPSPSFLWVIVVVQRNFGEA